MLHVCKDCCITFGSHCNCKWMQYIFSNLIINVSLSKTTFGIKIITIHWNYLKIWKKKLVGDIQVHCLTICKERKAKCYVCIIICNTTVKPPFYINHYPIWTCAILTRCTCTYDLMSWVIPTISTQHAFVNGWPFWECWRKVVRWQLHHPRMTTSISKAIIGEWLWKLKNHMTSITNSFLSYCMIWKAPRAWLGG